MPFAVSLAALSPVLALALGAGLGLVLGAVAAGLVARARGRRVREGLEAAEARRALLEGAADVVLVHDVDGRALETNRAGRAALGLGPGDPTLVLLDAVAVADRPAARAHLATLGEAGRARTDLRFGGADGVLLEVVSAVVDVGGRSRVVSVGRDVGARRERERALSEARAQAEEAARVRSQFLASMSHEIRTPLTSVVGFTELLRDEVDESQRGLVEAIEAGGQRLLATLDSVLDLATLDARRETLRRAPLDVVDAVEAAVEALRPQAEAKGLGLEAAASAPSIPALLDADALGRILAHVVGNAVRYTETGGVTVEVDADDRAVSLRVIDTGIGIPDSQLPTLFDGFKGPAEVRPGEGRGFGLAITDRLVRLMGGTISVESRWRAGTAVTVVLPRGEVPADWAPERRPAAATA